MMTSGGIPLWVAGGVPSKRIHMPLPSLVLLSQLEVECHNGRVAIRDDQHAAAPEDG